MVATVWKSSVSGFVVCWYILECTSKPAVARDKKNQWKNSIYTDFGLIWKLVIWAAHFMEMGYCKKWMLGKSERRVRKWNILIKDTYNTGTGIIYTKGYSGSGGTGMEGRVWQNLF